MRVFDWIFLHSIKAIILKEINGGRNKDRTKRRSGDEFEMSVLTIGPATKGKDNLEVPVQSGMIELFSRECIIVSGIE